MARSKLLPIFRTRAQEKLLADLFVRGDRALSLTELSARISVPLSTVQREIALLDRAGIVSSERVGNVRLVSPNAESPYYEELSSLLLKAFGPAAVLASCLAHTGGIERAFIFGSWARRYREEEGPAPNDVDLLVIGTVDPKEVYRSAREAEDSLGREVNPVVIRPEEWANPKGLARRIKAEPLVEVPLCE